MRPRVVVVRLTQDEARTLTIVMEHEAEDIRVRNASVLAQEVGSRCARIAAKTKAATRGERWAFDSEPDEVDTKPAGHR